MGASVKVIRELAKLRTGFPDWPTVALKAFPWKHFSLPNREIEIESRRNDHCPAGS